MGGPRVTGGGCGEGITPATPLRPGVPPRWRTDPHSPRGMLREEVWGGKWGGRGAAPPLRPYWLKVWGRGADWPPRFPPPQIPQRAAFRGHGRGRRRLRRPRGPPLPGAPEPRSGHAGSVGAVPRRAGRCPRQLLGGSVQLEGEVSSGMRGAGLIPIPIPVPIPISVPIPSPVPVAKRAPNIS